MKKILPYLVSVLIIGGFLVWKNRKKVPTFSKFETRVFSPDEGAKVVMSDGNDDVDGYIFKEIVCTKTSKRAQCRAFDVEKEKNDKFVKVNKERIMIRVDATEIMKEVMSKGRQAKSEDYWVTAYGMFLKEAYDEELENSVKPFNVVTILDIKKGKTLTDSAMLIVAPLAIEVVRKSLKGKTVDFLEGTSLKIHDDMKSFIKVIPLFKDGKKVIPEGTFKPILVDTKPVEVDEKTEEDDD